MTAAPTAELAVAERTLDLITRRAGEVEAEVAVDRMRLSLTRFANSVIHQNVAEDGTRVHVRVHRDGRTAAGSSTRVDPDGLRDLVERTLDAVDHAPPDPAWPGLAQPGAPPETAPVDSATAEATPDDRAAIVAAFVAAAGGLETAGSCRTTAWRGAFVNSAGRSSTGHNADVAVDGIARRAGADGVARRAANRIGDVDGAVLGARAAAKARAIVDPVELPPGRYEVVLEPEAVADLLNNLALFGFNGKSVNERRSFVQLGVRQFDPALTIVDDAPAAGWSHDAEGTPRQRLVLVEDGTTVAVAHDRRTAAEAGTESTGHATGSPSWGAFPSQLAMSPRAEADAAAAPPAEVDGPVADAAVAALVAGVQHGVLVSDLWYTRVLDPRTLAVTGLSRNGVWLIENGEIGRAVRNFRFTQEYPTALAPGAVVAVGTWAATQPDSWASARWTAPALRLAAWNITGGASG